MKRGELLSQLAMLVFAAVAVSSCAGTAKPSVETQIVDAMNKVFGAHPGFRANHAKGIVAQGNFKASSDAAELSRAALFDGATIPVTVRFSDGSGFPSVPDGAPTAKPHSMAVKFHLPDGSDTDMVINSLKFFPVATGEEFRDLLLARAASPADAPRPTPLQQFVASHPKVPQAFASAVTPDSFADQEYNSVNAFVLVNKAGERQAVRYVMAPARVVHLDPFEAARRPLNFLMDELLERLKRGPVIFRLKAQLAALGDPTNDPTAPWPADRKLVELGVLTIDKVVPNSAEIEKTLLFLPGALTDGIEPSDDPLIAVRDGAYRVSFSRRNAAAGGSPQPGA